MKKIYIALFITFLVINGMAQTNLADFRASQRNAAIELNWTALIEANMQTHQVERSTNGSVFHPVGTIVAENSNTPFKYTYMDAAPVMGENYYRVRSTSRNGDVAFSGIVRINMGAIRTNISVIPNPVRNGVVNLQLNNIDKGQYAITIVNSVGQRVFNYSLEHPGGSSTEILNLPANVGKGTHFLQVTNGSNRMNKQILLQ